MAAPVGLVGTLVAMAWFHDQSPVLYRGGFAAVCLVAALLVLGVEAAPHGPVARLLSLRPVAWIGLISYGLYLWHWPVFIALSPAHVDLSGTALLIARLAATVMIATLSFYLVERPIRSGALRRVPAMLGRSVVVLGLPAALTALMLGTAGGQAAPLPDSPFGPNAAGAGNRSILVVGDSIGSSLSVSFPQPSFPSWKVADATHLGCGLAVQYLSFQGERGIPNAECKGQLERWGAAVTKVQPDVVLLSTGAWEVFDHVVGGKDVAATSASYASYLGRKYDQAYDTLTADGAMLVVPTVPCYDQQAPSLRGMDDAVVRNDPSRASAVNAVIADFADRHPDVVLVDTGSYLCPGGEPRDQVNGVTLRDDGVHFSRQGGAIVWRQLLMPAITAGLTARSPNRSTALLVGDSVPLGLSKRFPTGDYPDLRVLDDTLLGCSAFSTPSVVDGTAKPMDPECSTWSASIPATLDRINPQVGLVFVGIGEQYDKLVDGEVIAFGTSAHDEWLADNLRQRIGLFRDRDIPVVVVTSPCHRVIDITETADSKIINDDTRVRRNNRVLTDVAGDYPTGVSVVDLHHELCPDGFEPVVDGVRLYEDGLHFNDQGAALVWSILVPAIEAARTS